MRGMKSKATGKPMTAGGGGGVGRLQKAEDASKVRTSRTGYMHGGKVKAKAKAKPKGYMQGGAVKKSKAKAKAKGPRSVGVPSSLPKRLY